MKKSPSLVRFGFIGAGQIAYSAANALKSHKQAVLMAVHDTHPDRLKALCEKCEVKHGFATIRELLDSDEVDALYIATPNKFHVPLAKKALEAGKHVILEKPFAMSAKEAEDAIRTARKCKRVLTVGMNQRFTGDSQKVKTLVERGVLGDIYHAKAYWRRRTGIPKLGTWFGDRKLAGGGALYDIGVHMLDLCLFTMGNFAPVSVTGQTYTKFGNRGWGMSERTNVKFDVEDFATALIRFANGATVTLDAAWACHTAQGSVENVELFGTEAGASLRPARLYRFGRTRKDEYRVIEDLKASLAMPHKDRFHNFINHLLGREPLCATLEQSLVVQKILDAVALSSRTGREVRLPGAKAGTVK
jgi:predicted dehydrogenase